MAKFLIWTPKSRLRSFSLPTENKHTKCFVATHYYNGSYLWSATFESLLMAEKSARDWAATYDHNPKAESKIFLGKPNEGNQIQ